MEASKAVSAKKLKEHLQHQQEPFSLHKYLKERRYSVDSIIKHDEKKHKTISRKRLLHASKILRLRSLLYKFIPMGEVGITASDDHYSNHEAKDLPYQQHNPNLEMNMFHSLTLPKLTRLEVDAGTKPHWIGRIEKQQQHYKELKWKEALPKSVCPVTAISTLSQKSARDPMLSTYIRKLLLNSNILKLRRAKKHKLQDIIGITSLCRRNKRNIHKRKQSLFGCVEKARGFQENKGNSDHFGLLEKQCGEFNRISHFLCRESCILLEEWGNFQKLHREISKEIGDAIMDDIVKEILDIFLN